MANSSTKTESFQIGKEYTIKVTGFTYVKEWALVKGQEVETGTSVGIIIGDKLSFNMRDMFELKNSNGLKATFRQDKVVNGVSYPQFQLTEILF